MLSIIEKMCQFAPDRTKATVVVRSDQSDFSAAFVELQEGYAARNLALAFAAQSGVTSPRINGNVTSPYAVNRDGVPLDMVRGPDQQVLDQRHASMQPFRYQIEVPVIQPLL